MKQTFGTSPEYDKAVGRRLWQLWLAASGMTSPDIFLAFYKAGQKGYKLEDLTVSGIESLIQENLKKIKGGVA